MYSYLRSSHSLNSWTIGSISKLFLDLEWGAFCGHFDTKNTYKITLFDKIIKLLKYVNFLYRPQWLTRVPEGPGGVDQFFCL